jgi:hypothetical protein
LESIVVSNHFSAGDDQWYGWNFCPYGAGVAVIHWGADDNRNGSLDGGWWTGESDGWTFVCDAVDPNWGW